MDYSQKLFDTIDTILEQRLNSVSFDKTETCEVIKKYEDEDNRYLVSNGSLKYDAYASEGHKEYGEGSKVYVTIPQGDYSQTKIIIGSYSSTDKVLKRASPFDSLVTNSKYELVVDEKPLVVGAATNGTSYNSDERIVPVKIYKSGFGKFDYCGIEFSASTGFGGTEGEFIISIQFVDSQNNVLIEFPFSSTQIYGNPYYLDESLRFQHLFPFGDNDIDVEQIANIKIGLHSNGAFNYEGIIQTITLNNLILHLGFDKTEISAQAGIITLVKPFNNTEYSSSADEKVMNLEWADLENNAIYGAYKDMQIDNEDYTVYWLQYSESIGYKKFLETDGIIVKECYNEDIGIYSNNLKNAFVNEKGEDIMVYDPSTYEKYLSIHSSNWGEFLINIESIFIDIEESGVYWKTVKKENANQLTAYQYTLIPSESWKKEQIKVIVKSANDIIYTNGLTFENSIYTIEPGISSGIKDNLVLTLGENDDGIYNNYGLNNKILSQSNTHTVTVDYVDNTKWNGFLQKTVWKIPKKASMITIPKIWNSNSGQFEEDYRWDSESDSNYYLYTSMDIADDAKTITFSLSDIFGFNKTNNTIYCEITRYKDTSQSIIDNIYNGSITLQFGTQGTSGSNYAFNIYPSRSGGILLGDDNDSITFTAKLENNNGETIPFDVSNISWYFLCGDTKIGNNDSAKQATYIVNRSLLKSLGKYADYAVLVAELKSIQDANGLQINLKAYYSIASTVNNTYYMEGPTKIIYNYQGTSPSYDESPYRLYAYDLAKHEHVKAPVNWSIKAYDNKSYSCPSIVTVDETEGILNPLPNIETNVVGCAVVASVRGEVIWSQPLLIMRNSYSFNALNIWDEETGITDEMILSQLIGAGTKDDENRFTGVLMGAVGAIEDDANTGLYGFQNGVLRYKLDEQGSFYVGTGNDNFISFNEKIEDQGRSGSEELAIKTKKFELITYNLDISSKDKYIAIYEKQNEQKILRVKLGCINEEYYGLNIYDGCFKLYSEGKSEPVLYFDQQGNMKLDGIISRTATRKPEDINFTNTTSTIFGEQKISININFREETWLSGISLKTDYTNIAGQELTAKTYFGMTEGRSVTSETNFHIPPPMLMLTTGEKHIRQYIATTSDDTEGVDSFNAVVIASSTEPDLNISHWGLPEKRDKTATLVVYAYHYDRDQDDYMSGVTIHGTLFTNDTASDMRLKHNIETFDDRYEMFFDNLIPKRYKYNNGTSNRYHTGFIAQEVLVALDNSNISTQEFAGIMMQAAAPGEERYYHLRKEEFVSLNTWQIQKLKSRVTILENEIKEIKQRYENQ